MNGEIPRKLSWPRVISLAVIILAVAGTSYWLISSSNNKPKTIAQSTCTSKSTSKKCPSKIATTTPSPSSTKSNTQSNTSNSSNSGTSISSSASTLATTPAVTNNSTTQLINTGPGNVIGIFISSAFIGGTIHLRYHLAKSRTVTTVLDLNQGILIQ